MKQSLSVALMLGAILSLSAAAYAQEEEPAEPVQAELTAEDQLWQERIDRAQDFRLKMLQTRRGVELFYEFRNRNAEELQENRDACQEDLRRANRDTKFSTLRNCYRRELALNIELREKQKQYIESIPGVSEQRRAAALSTLDDLLSALEALQEGVESDVFHNEEDLIAAKKNLHKTYRVPLLLAELQVESDRALTWVSHLMHRLFTMTQNTELGPDAFQKASEALACFDEGEALLKEMAALEGYEDTYFSFSQALKSIRSCVKLLEEAHTLQEEFENPPSEETEIRDDISPRRRWGNM